MPVSQSVSTSPNLGNPSFIKIAGFSFFLQDAAQQVPAFTDLKNQDKQDFKSRIDSLINDFQCPSMANTDDLAKKVDSRWPGTQDSKSLYEMYRGKRTANGYYYAQPDYAKDSLSDAAKWLQDSMDVITDNNDISDPEDRKKLSAQYLKNASASLKKASDNLQTAKDAFYHFDGRVWKHYDAEQARTAQEIKEFLTMTKTNTDNINTDLWNKMKENKIVK